LLDQQHAGPEQVDKAIRAGVGVGQLLDDMKKARQKLSRFSAACIATN
jgi:hypothetical protein